MNLKQANRMLHHAWVLRTQADPDVFNMETAYCEGRVDERHPCGTSACAMGYMAVAFPKLFKMKTYDNGDAFIPVYRKDGEWFKPQKFYGIEYDEVGYLFGGDSRRTINQQAKVMEDFVRSKGYEVTDE